MSNKIKSPTQKQGNQVNSLCIPALPRVGHNIDWCISALKQCFILNKTKVVCNHNVTLEIYKNFNVLMLCTIILYININYQIIT
jgi:hypothetical protein